MNKCEYHKHFDWEATESLKYNIVLNMNHQLPSYLLLDCVYKTVKCKGEVGPLYVMAKGLCLVAACDDENRV